MRPDDQQALRAAVPVDRYRTIGLLVFVALLTVWAAVTRPPRHRGPASRAQARRTTGIAPITHGGNSP